MPTDAAKDFDRDDAHPLVYLGVALNLVVLATLAETKIGTNLWLFCAGFATWELIKAMARRVRNANGR